MAEMETYHSQKIEDFETLTKEHLDGEIQLYEQVRYIAYGIPVVAYLTDLFSDTVKAESCQGEL